MEELNKNQLVLLALLVSFVTSLATGIVTVSLMEQAPQSVTQTINKVVTQTIEKAVTVKEPAAVVAAIPEEDLITAAVEKNVKGTLKIRLGNQGDVVGFGTMLTPGGLIATDVSTGRYAAEAKYFAVLQDGKEVPIALALEDKSGISFFQAALPEGYKAEAVALGNSDKLKLGQAALIIAPSGELQKGIVSGLVKDSITATATTTETAITSVKLIKLSIILSLENSGSPLVNLSGETVGITFYRDGVKVAVPSNVIKEGMAALSKADR